MHPTFVEAQRAFLCKGQCVWTNGIPRIFAAAAPASAGFQCILGSRAPLLWQGVSPGPAGSRNLRELLGLLCARLTAWGPAPWQVLVSKEGLPGGGRDSPSLGKPLRAAKLWETHWDKIMATVGLVPAGPPPKCLRPIKRPRAGRKSYGQCLCLGTGLVGEFLFFFRVTGFFHWLEQWLYRLLE